MAVPKHPSRSEVGGGGGGGGSGGDGDDTHTHTHARTHTHAHAHAHTHTHTHTHTQYGMLDKGKAVKWLTAAAGDLESMDWMGMLHR